MMRTDEMAVDQGTVPQSTLLWTEEPSPGPPVGVTILAHENSTR